MANNGFLSNGVCLPVQDYVSSFCPSGAAYSGVTLWASGGYERYCPPVNGVVSYTRFGDPNCEISGPALTEQQQIEAINGLFPYAVAIIAVAWGFKFIRGLIENWLRDRNSDD